MVHLLSVIFIVVGRRVLLLSSGADIVRGSVGGACICHFFGVNGVIQFVDEGFEVV